MTRKPLTPSAIVIADKIRQRASMIPDCQAAEAIGVDNSTLCRFKADHLDKLCAYLDFLGFKVVDRDVREISEADLNALKKFAMAGISLIGSGEK